MNSVAYHIIKTMMKLLSAIPRQTIARLGFPLGLAWYAVDRRHRNIAMENMRIAFGDKWDRRMLRKQLRANFIQLARLALELPSLMRLDKHNMKDHVTFSGLHHITRLLHEKKPLLLLTAHFGNWELMALSWALQTRRRCNVVARPIDFPPFRRVMTEIRSITGNRVIDKDDSQPIISGLLRENEMIGTLLDQNASWYEGVYVPFFGRLACTNKGAALFALRYGAIIVPAFNSRQPDGRYKITIEPPVPLVRTGDIAEDIMVNTERFNRIIEAHIRRAPDNWFWVHRRWRIINIPPSHRKKFDQAVARYPGALGAASPGTPQPDNTVKDSA